jgi:hypothetical protein
MAQSERSKHAQAQAGWITYQKYAYSLSEEEAAARPMPQQFKDIFLVGFALGEESAKKRARTR